MLADHPGREELCEYGQGLLPPEAALALEEHLAACADCCELLERTPADSFLSRLRVAASEADPDTADYAGPAGTVADAVPPPLADHPKYRVLGLVGQGGMGAVYRAEHRRMERVVALKVINPSLTRHPAAVRRFRQEVRAAAQLDHPNIVRAFDADEADGVHFLVMEYVEGAGLADTVRRRGPLPAAEACAYVRQAALALQHAHERGMVHRDIKPHNLMLTAGGLLKVLDFGLARLAQAADEPSDGGPAAASLTGAGAVMGTADYIAPEQAADPRTADRRADLYALGCTLFHLLTGRPPFPDGTVSDKLARHADTPLPAVLGVPPALAGVLGRMTAKRPADRYATAAQVAAALEPFCPGRPRSSRRRWSRVAALALLAAAALTGVAIRMSRPDRDAATGRTPVPLPVPDDLPSPPPGKDIGKGNGNGTPVLRLSEAEAVRIIERLGGRLTRSAVGLDPPVVTVTLTGLPVTDDDLRAVASFPHLRTLDVAATPVTDAGLEHLAGLTELTSLVLRGTRVTDAGMRHVGALKQLRSLDLQQTAVGDAGIRHLAGLTELRALSLRGRRVTDAGLADIAAFKDLSSLTIDDSDITDAGLKRLAGLTELTTLRLTSARGVGDEGMKTVARFRRLLNLDLSGTSVTDRGLRELAGLDQLSCLRLSRLRITGAGLEALAGLDRLVDLDLSYTDVDDAAVRWVAGHRRLVVLNLTSAAQVTDAGVTALAGLPELKSLILSGTKTTDAGLVALAGLPKLYSLALVDTDVTAAGVRALARCPRLTLLFLGKNSRVTAAEADQLRTAMPKVRLQR